MTAHVISAHGLRSCNLPAAEVGCAEAIASSESDRSLEVSPRALMIVDK
jgi:hypothetical protein